MRLRLFAAAAGLTLLAGCASTVTPTAAATTAATAAATAAAGLVSPATATIGQEFCAKATADGPLIAALVDTAGVPVIVTNVASAVVADACKAWDGAAVPVSPPATPVPTVAIVLPTA